MIPAAIVCLAAALIIGIWLIAKGADDKLTESKLQRSVTDTNRRIDELEKQLGAVRNLLDDLIVGHVNEAQLKRVLSRILVDEK